MTELKQRVTSALIIAAVVIAVLVGAGYFASLLVFSQILILLLFLVSVTEFALMAKITSLRALAVVSFSLPLVFFILSYWLGASLFYSSLVISFLLLILLVFIFGRNDLEIARNIFSEYFPSWLLIVAGFYSLLALSFSENFSKNLLWLLLVVCFNDIGAYFAGRSLGVTKLAPGISPGKTWIGSLGGFLTGLLIAVLFGFLVIKQLAGFYSLLGFSLLLILAAQLGDLLESYLKRLYDLKDSSQLIPGHGGVLDRLDGILLAVSFFYFFL